MPDLKPASRLRLARVAKGWRIGALADEMGVPASTLWRIETGAIKEPRLRIRKALAKVLGVAESQLFGKVGR